VLVADPADGRVYWRPASSIGGANSDCKWTLLGNNNITTAYAGNPGCPQENNRIGIGTGDPVRAKLEVVDNPNANQTFPYGQIGVQVDVRGRATSYQAGVDVLFDPGPPFGEGPLVAPASRTGVNVLVPGGGNLVQGVNAYSVGSAASTLVYGVNVEADVQSTTNAGAFGIGLRSRAVGNTQATVYGLRSEVVLGNAGSYAANLIGNLNVQGLAFCTNNVWTVSDESIKTDVQPLVNALEVLSQVQPSTFNFMPEAAPGLSLPQGTQPGVIAQQLQQVLPALVTDYHVPPAVNDEGLPQGDGQVIKAVNYTGLIPYTVAGIQELLARLTSVEAQLAQCCAAGMANGSGSDRAPQGAAVAATDLRTERLQIIPNPVAPSTILRYYVPRAGRVRLELSAEDGRSLETLLEMRAAEGEQQYTWDTSRLSAGVYLVALVVDEQVVVKRAVKVD